MIKRISKAFGKKVYLLGENIYNEWIWLEEPKWDCGWYWGFGYIETYTNNERPDLSNDIQSHSHFNGLVWYHAENNKYIYHINEVLIKTVLTDNESWELSDLMKRFYSLRETAEIFHRGTANYTFTGKCNNKNPKLEKHINEVELPKIFKAVNILLSPS